MEPVIKKDIGGTISTYHYHNENKVGAGELSNVKGTAYTPSGGELIAETVIVPEMDGEMAIAIPAENAGTSYEWCRAHFVYDYGGETFTQDLYFHIAHTNFDIPFHYDDLVKFVPSLGDYAWSSDPKFANQRDVAWAEIYSRLLNGGKRPWKILNRSALNQAFAYLWLHHIFMSLSKSPDDIWHERALDYRQQYEDTFVAINILEKSIDSANVGDESATPIQRTRLKRG